MQPPFAIFKDFPKSNKFAKVVTSCSNFGNNPKGARDIFPKGTFGLLNITTRSCRINSKIINKNKDQKYIKET
jgi:hypothetical protein